jgi:hypothetical protein
VCGPKPLENPWRVEGWEGLGTFNPYPCPSKNPCKNLGVFPTPVIHYSLVVVDSAAEELEAAVESEAEGEDMVLRTASRGFTSSGNDVCNSMVFFIFIQSFFRMFQIVFIFP